jgi:4-amino-4-deoxy-L-arabinose transferase-like glycosyltransferase
VTAIASCKAGQRGADWPEKQHGLFAWLLAQGYAGAADKNRDGRLEPTELFGYLQGAMAAAAGQLKATQTPELFLPDNRPPRLSEDAKSAIRRLAAYLGQDKIDMQEAQKDYDAAAEAAGKEPEPKQLWGLLLLKDKQRDQALKRFDQLRLERPDLLPPLMAVAWARFDRRVYQSGVDGLAELVSAIPSPNKPDQPYPDALQQTFSWVGQLREFAAVAAEEARRPSAASLEALDAAVVRHGPDAQRFYEQGQAKSRQVAADFDRQIAAAIVEADAARLKVERRRIVHYVEFPFDRTAREILAGLDQ